MKYSMQDHKIARSEKQSAMGDTESFEANRELDEAFQKAGESDDAPLDKPIIRPLNPREP